MIPHLIAAPIILPLVTAALLALIGSRRTRVRTTLNIGATVACLFVAITLLRHADANGGTIGVYLASNWEAPFGIVLVADRLSALMLVLVAVVSLCGALYAEAGWSRAGVHFYPLFQMAVMGLNGAFLTGDLFNLFVLFEVLLAASYGLQLHGSGPRRVRTGLHYIAVNLLGSAVFLIGLALFYGVMGTLSMADIASKLPDVPASDRGLLHVGAAAVAVAFLIKAAIWPLNSWLAPAYSAASAPVAALFALMTKVGVYALIRLWTLFFPADAAVSAGFGGSALLTGGLATIAVGTLALMGAIHVARIASFSIIVSSGTLLSALVIGGSMLSAALFYMLSTTVAVSALFLLSEMVDRPGLAEAPRLKEVEPEPDEDTNLDDAELPLVGRMLPVSVVLLGIAFICVALVVSGLPPLSGFIAKVSLLRASLDPQHAATPWIFGLLLVAGLAATVALSRAGIRHFWQTNVTAVRVKVIEAVSVVVLIAGCVALTVFAESVMRYTSATAADLHAPNQYIDRVMSTLPRPGPTRPNVEDGKR